MFSAIRNTIGYQNVAFLMRHSAEYETTDVIAMAGARPWARLVAQRLSSAR